jgi:hypothetical protein
MQLPKSEVVLYRPGGHYWQVEIRIAHPEPRIVISRLEKAVKTVSEELRKQDD